MGASCKSKDTGIIAVLDGARRNSALAPNSTRSSSRGSTASDFLPFSHLNDDVILCILSFVSYAPFENDVSGIMTLADLDNHNPEEGAPTLPHDTIDANEEQRLRDDYNHGATRLNKRLLKTTQLCYRRALWRRRSTLRAGQRRENHHPQLTYRQVPMAHSFGTLTHVLPLVNKRFHRLCSFSSLLWTECLERLMKVRSSQVRIDMGPCVLWEDGVKSFIASTDSNDDICLPALADGITNGSKNEHSTETEHDKIQRLIAEACDCVDNNTTESQIRTTSTSTSTSAACEVLKQVALHHKPIRLPVFSMYYPASIGVEIHIRLFEPRYRLLIAEVMTGRSEREKCGLPLLPSSSPCPRFLFACRSDGWRRKVACIVEVRRCEIRRDGVADIFIVPVAWTIMHSLATRPESGGLVDATLLRSPTRRQLPAFCMRTHMVLEQPLGLRLYEERYKTLIAEVMEKRSDEERNGSLVVSHPRPQFVFVCNNRFKEGDVACLVDVERCRMHNDGSAQVTVVPTAWVLIESFKMRPWSGKLYDASVLSLQL